MKKLLIKEVWVEMEKLYQSWVIDRQNKVKGGLNDVRNKEYYIGNFYSIGVCIFR